MPYPYNSVLDSGLIYPITAKAISGNKIKNRGGTIYGAGAARTSDYRPNVSNSMTFAQTAVHAQYGKNRVMLSVSPTDSGNLGTFNPISGGTFNAIQKKHYIGMYLTDLLANVANTTSKSPGFGNQTRRFADLSRGFYSWNNVVSWNYVDGIPTYGNIQNTAFTFQDGAGSTVNVETKPTAAIPGKMTLMITGKIPTELNYGARHNF